MLANQIGYYSLILGFFFSILIIPVSIKNFNNKNQIINSKIFSISFFQFFFVLVSFCGLILSFVNSDFSNQTVYNNSHTTKPLFYKISGTWGNHEGSLLLWLLVLTLFIFLFLIKSSKQPKKYRILTLIFQQIIIIGFFLFILITSNPFNYLFPEIALCTSAELEIFWEKMRSIRQYGVDFSNTLMHNQKGTNFKMSEFVALFGICELDRVQERIGKRQVIAERYQDNLSGSSWHARGFREGARNSTVRRPSDNSVHGWWIWQQIWAGHPRYYLCQIGQTG